MTMKVRVLRDSMSNDHVGNVYRVAEDHPHYKYMPRDEYIEIITPGEAGETWPLFKNLGDDWEVVG
jgi:hypothetical protein